MPTTTLPMRLISKTNDKYEATWMGLGDDQDLTLTYNKIQKKWELYKYVYEDSPDEMDDVNLWDNKYYRDQLPATIYARYKGKLKAIGEGSDIYL